MDKYDKVTVTVRTQSGRCFPDHNREIIVIFFAVSDRSTEKKWEEQRMRNLKKALCGIMTGMMIITAAPAAIPGTGIVTEVQAATIGTPKMVSVKAVGKSTVAVKWSAVKGAAGYRVMRKTNSGRWVNLKDIAGASKVSYSDTKVSVGNKYTYTVRAYTKNKKTMSSYNKTGLSAVAGISTLKLSKSTLSVFAGSSYTLKVTGAKISPKWSSSNTKVATVSSTGKVSGKKVGTAKITAKLGGRTFTCTVKVKEKPVYEASATVKNNYAKLINAVKANGGKLRDVRTSKDGTKVTTVITYSESKSQLHFSSTLISGKDSIKVDTYLTGTKIDQMKVISTLGDAKYSATLNATTWTGSGLTFYTTMGGKAYWMSALEANTYTQLSFTDMNRVIKNETGLTLKDLGFARF